MNYWGGLGHWAYFEITHMENAVGLIRSTILKRGRVAVSPVLTTITFDEAMTVRRV